MYIDVPTRYIVGFIDLFYILLSPKEYSEYNLDNITL